MNLLANILEETVGKLLVYLKNYKKESILGPLFKLLEALFELIVPLIMAAIIDRGIANGDKSYVIKMCLVLVALGIIGLICSITAQYFAAKAAVGFAKELKHSLFEHIQGLSYSELDVVGTNTLITRMTSDMNQVQAGVNLTLRLLLRSPFVVFGAMIMAFTIDFKAALIFVITIPLLSIVVFGIMLWCIPRYKLVQQKLDKVLGITRENLTGVRVIRAFCKEDEETDKFINSNDSLTITQKHVGRVSALMNPMTYIIINMAIVVLVWTGAVRVDVGIIAQGSVVALYNYMSQILVELVKLANLIINITKSVACGNRIQAIFELEPEAAKENKEKRMLKGQVPEKQTDIAVEFRDVSLKYQQAGEESLSEINFAIKKGQTVGIIGGTGCGKTSLINLIPGFYKATKGQVIVDGIDVKDYNTEELRSKIGVVMQKAVLFSGTIRENIKWGNKDASDKEIYDALTIAQAKEIVDGRKEGLDYFIEQGGKNLSGGQKQRFTIARALVMKPQILILDDSASALDYATDAALRKAIAGMDKDMTVFIVSQRASAVMNADIIIVLDDGKIAGIGNQEELLNTCATYQEIYYSQYRKEN